VVAVAETAGDAPVQLDEADALLDGASATR
jgi:hypothetical protein